MDDRYRFVDLHLCVCLSHVELIPSHPADPSTQSTQMVTELWIRATGLTAGTSWTRMLLSLRSVPPRLPALTLFRL